MKVLDAGSSLSLPCSNVTIHAVKLFSSCSGFLLRTRNPRSSRKYEDMMWATNFLLPIGSEVTPIPPLLQEILNCGCRRGAYTQSLLAIINEKFGDVRGLGLR